MLLQICTLVVIAEVAVLRDADVDAFADVLHEFVDSFALRLVLLTMSFFATKRFYKALLSRRRFQKVRMTLCWSKEVFYTHFDS